MFFRWGLRTIAGQNIPYMMDIAVKDMMKPLQQQFPERRQELLDLLEIDPEWIKFPQDEEYKYLMD